MTAIGIAMQTPPFFSPLLVTGGLGRFVEFGDDVVQIIALVSLVCSIGRNGHCQSFGGSVST